MLTSKQKKELAKLAKEILEEAKLVTEDYQKNESNMSGSMIQIHEHSPLLSDSEISGSSNDS